MRSHPAGLAAFVAVASLGGSAFLTCDTATNPFYDASRVSITSTLSAPVDTAYRVGDTVWCKLAVHLPYLIDTLTIRVSDSVCAIRLPTSEAIVDYADSVAHVFTAPGRYAFALRAVRSDGVTIAVADSLTLLGRPPSATASLQTVQAVIGTACSLSVSASGTGPFTYAWRKNGLPTGDTGAVLRLSPVTSAHAGVYRCVVKSAWGLDTSDSIVLVVVAADMCWLQDTLRLSAESGDTARLELRTLCSDTIPGDTVRFRVLGSDPHASVAGTLFRFAAGVLDSGRFVVLVIGSNGRQDMSEPVVVTVQRTGICQSIASGTSLDQAIKQASVSPVRPKRLCLQQGFYEQNTVRVCGTVKIIVE